MKKTFLLASLLISFSLIKAQEGKSKVTTPTNSTQQVKGKKGEKALTPDQKADKFAAKLTEVTGIDEKQKSKVRSLALDHFKNMANVRDQAKGDKEKIKAEGKNSRKVFNEGLKKVLTAAQFETWKSKRKEVAKKQNGAPTNEPVEMIED